MNHAQREVMHWLTHPRTILAAAIAASIAGVIGESEDGSVLVHLVSVVSVVVGLVVVVLTVPGGHDPGDM
jgi:hypothetical protein